MWHIPEGHEHNFIDGRTHEHHIKLVNSVTGGEHHVVIRLGANTCPHCNRIDSVTDIGSVDHKAIIEQEVAMLQSNHDELMKYATERGIPIRVGEHHSVAPETHSLISAGKHKMLVPKRKQAK